MLNFKEGQTYICTESRAPWWTEGKEYQVKSRVTTELYLLDDECSEYDEDYINLIQSTFKLKGENKMNKEELQSSDLIENQPHYKNQGIEPIELMRKNFSKEEFAGFLQGNVLKYMLRYKDKNGLEDLKKAKTYLTWLIKEEENAEV